MTTERLCGCKGIRTCLFCEKANGFSMESHRSKEVKYVYTYCPDCNLCCPDDKKNAPLHGSPLYLGRLQLFPEFFSDEEEASVISSIDKIPWMPSQSGRRKQDFGPKVNFKKKKVKTGEFKGFPKFTQSILQRLQKLPELSDFQPVELCHLEYSPERGSSIDPHVDDFWLWGERLVTINLGSPTVLTLVPCANGSCECLQCSSSVNGRHTDDILCDHEPLNSLNSGETSAWKEDARNGNMYFEVPDDKNSKASTVGGQNATPPDSSTQTKRENKFPDYLLNQDCHKISDCDIRCSNCKPAPNSFEIPDSTQNTDENLIIRDYQHRSPGPIPSESGSKSRKSSDHETCHCKVSERRIETMCRLFRTCNAKSEAAVRVVLPPRSLLVLSGCARYNWSHEIKRQDVVSRRLAMTFRELTPEFLNGGRESQMGKELLLIANNFYDL